MDQAGDNSSYQIFSMLEDILNEEDIDKETKGYKSFIEKTVEELSHSQRKCLLTMLELYNLMKFTGQFTDLAQVNHLGYVSYFLRVANLIENEPQDKDSCWLIESDDAYPSLHITSLEFRDIAGQGYRVYGMGNKGTWAVHRIMASLIFTDMGLKDRDRQASHKCWRPVQRCGNPFHMTIASDIDNKDRSGCKYGAKELCPHKDNCLFRDPETGTVQPCREGGLALFLQNGQCQHQPNCFSYKN